MVKKIICLDWEHMAGKAGKTSKKECILKSQITVKLNLLLTLMFLMYYFKQDFHFCIYHFYYQQCWQYSDVYHSDRVYNNVVLQSIKLLSTNKN